MISNTDRCDSDTISPGNHKMVDPIRGVDPFFSVSLQSRISPNKDDPFAKSSNASESERKAPLLEEVMYPSLLMLDSPDCSAASSPEKGSNEASPFCLQFTNHLTVHHRH